MNATPSFSKNPYIKTASLQAGVLVVVLVVSGLYLRALIRDRFINQVSNHLRTNIEMLATKIPNEPDANWCKEVGHAIDLWISLISSIDGRLYCDSVYKPGAYPGVIDRPEIQSALLSTTHRGQSVRLSPNSGDNQGVFSTLYFPDKKFILRVGLPLAPFEQDLRTVDRYFIMTVLILAILLIVILQWTTQGYLFKRAKKAFVQQEKQMQDDFAANVSHELRTPLTSILGFADASLRKLKGGDKPDQEYLEIIHRDANRLLSMVNDILDLSALDSGALHINKIDVNVEEITEDVLKRLHVVYGYKNQIIQTHYKLEWIHADPDRLLQVLLNLLANSMRFSQEGATIAITWLPTELRIADNGPGISGDIKLNLFKRFHAASPTKTKTAGAGLGLAIVKGIIHAHGWSIDLDPSRVQGTEFVIRWGTVKGHEQ